MAWTCSAQLVVVALGLLGGAQAVALRSRSPAVVRSALTRRAPVRASAWQPLSSAGVAAADGAHATSLLLGSEGQDLFRLALTGGVGIMVFAILNTFLVSAVARGNWQYFEEEAASWVKAEPGMEATRSKMLSNSDLGLGQVSDAELDADEE